MTGTLKGYDQLVNLVLDEAIEHERGAIIYTIDGLFIVSIATYYISGD